jgi:putative transposase
MMQEIERLEYGSLYHVYNSGVQGCRLFRETADYERFLADYERYVDVIARTLAWCLMGNHFHFIIKILKEEDILPFSELPVSNQLKTYGSGSNIALTESSTAGSNLPLTGSSTAGSNLPLTGSSTAGSNLPLTGSSTAGSNLPLTGSSTADRGGVILRKPKPSTQLSHLFNSYAQYYNKKYQRRGVLFEKGFRRKIVDDPEYLKNLIDYIHNNPVKHGFADHPWEYPWSSFTNIRLNQPKP